MKQAPFRGTAPALITPFTADNQIDETALRRVIDFQISGGDSGFRGVNALVVLGTTGENPTVSAEERQRIVEELARSRQVHLEVTTTIYPKVTLQVCEQAVRFDKIVKGPLKIGWGRNKQLQFQPGDGPARPLTTVATSLKRAA